MATVQDIAKAANVSPAAVSLVLNGREGVGADTRRRVQDVMRRLDYRPRHPGRPARPVKTLNVGILYSQGVVRAGGALSALASTWISAMRQEAISAGHHVSIFSGGSAVDDQVFHHALAQRELDGVILIGLSPGGGYLERIQEAGLPAVLMNRRPRRHEFSWVEMDNYGGGRAAARHLLDLGHRRLALFDLGGEPLCYQEHCQGFVDELAAAGLTPALCVAVSPFPEASDVVQVARQLVDSGVTGVFAASDLVGGQLLAALRKLGCAVPGDLSVVGFDDVGGELSERFSLTSVGYDKALMGREAAAMLVDLATRGGAVRCRSLVVPTQVVDHGTTRAV